MFIGHKIQRELLIRIARSGRVPQAFIFSGADQLGKKTLAFDFVKFLNCQEWLGSNENQEPCGRCFSCKLITQQKHPDLIIIEPEKKEIQVGQIRSLQRALNFKPQLSSFKAVIIDEAHCLNIEAQNCFLKTLEEPPGKTIFIFVTARPEALFKTIHSRCEVVKFYPVAFDEIERSLKGKFPLVQLREFVSISEGKPGKVLSLLENPQKFSLEIETKQKIQKLLEAEPARRLSFVADIFSREVSNNDLIFFIEIFIKYLRMLLFKKLDINDRFFPLSLEAEKALKNYPISKLQGLINLAERLRLLLFNTNVNQRLVLETLILNL